MIFFVWLDPQAPLAAAAAGRPMPPKYADNVAAWRQRYGEARVAVLDGAACLEAVCSVDRMGHVPGLADQYRSFAGR